MDTPADKILKYTYRLNEIDRIARRILDEVPAGVWFFDAPMGAGKTTLIGRLIARLTGEPFLGSPTFSLVHEYRMHDGRPVFHWDLYRIKDAEELLAAGFEEYLDDAAYVFIEWPALAEDFADNPVRFLLRPDENRSDQRYLEIRLPE